MAKTILVVDDSASMRQVVSMALKQAGHEVIEACDGKDALAKLDGRKFNLIISDVNMPNLDGIDATRRIRALPDGAGVPILAMTANAFAEDKVRCFEAGMNDFLAKPIDPEALFAILAKWLGR